MSIAANKVKGIRCAHVTNTSEAILSRQHNNANIIALGANGNKVNANGNTSSSANNNGTTNNTTN